MPLLRDDEKHGEQAARSAEENRQRESTQSGISNINKINAIIKKMPSWKGQNTAVRNFLKIYHNKSLDIPRMEERFNKYLQLFSEFHTLMDDLTVLDEDFQHHSPTETSQIEADFYENVSEYERLIAIARGNSPLSAQNREQTNSAVSHDGRRRLRLPESTLPTFNGEYENWMSFKAEFESMIDSQYDISDIDKLTYLRQALRNSAYDKIKMLPIASENYSRAWELLKQTYEDERLIISRHINLLLDLPKQETENATGLSKLVDDTRQHLELLKAMKIQIPEQMMVIIIERKLHRNTADDWDETQRQGVFPSLNDMLDFLARRAARIIVRNKDTISSSVSPGKYKSDKSHKEMKGAHTFVTSAEGKCVSCNQPFHALYTCKKFKQASVPERRKITKDAALCFNCLRNGHRAPDCNYGNCKVCGEKHNTLLHLDNETDNNQIGQAGLSTYQPKQHNALLTKGPTNQIMTTARIKVMAKDGSSIITRVLLDTCSTANFMTESLASKLQLSKKKCSIPVGALNELSTHTRHLVTATIQSADGKYQKNMNFLTIPQIADFIPSQPIRRESISFPGNIRLADPEFHIPAPIEVLLGTGPTLSLLSVGQIKLSHDHESELYLQKTQLGWVLGGSVLSASRQSQEELCHHTTAEFDLTKFWEIEQGTERIHLSNEELAAEEHYKRYHTRDVSGRYIVALPFNKKQENIGSSRERALKGFHTLERRFKLNPEFKDQYTAIIDEYLNLGHMSRITTIEDSGFYLPHHAVIKAGSLTTKCRVVFDGSAQSTSGISLNDALLTGPHIQDDIITLILRFRCHKYVITGDIEKMYRQFLVRLEDRRYQRIFWRGKDGQLSTYELNTVTFGLAAAPFLAIRCLHQLADDESTQYPIASQILKKDFYVDDLLTGFDSIEKAKAARDEITALLKCSGLHIRQWASNDPTLLQDLPDSSINQRLQLSDGEPMKTLGISWKAQSDSIVYSVTPIIIKKVVKKRTILSRVAKIFDPLGLLGPIILTAKRLTIKGIRLFQFIIFKRERDKMAVPPTTQSPHFGGIWEAAVKSFKHHFKRVVGNELFTFEELNTLIIEIEAILNSRPLTPMSSDPNNLSVLTPDHFLIGDTLTSLPEHNFSDTRRNRLSTWQHIQKVRQDFWARWYKEYLNELNVRRKWSSGEHHIKEGAIVLLKDDNLPPMQWKLGRVIKTHPGDDGVIRVVSVQTSTGLLDRSIKKLAPLPISETFNE